MRSNPKIIVFKLREVVYTLVLAFLAIVLVVCLVLMFLGKAGGSNRQAQNSEATSETGSVTDGTEPATAAENSQTASAKMTTRDTAAYVAGVYTSPVTLGDASVDVQVTVSQDSILAIDLVNLSEATEAAYPLVPSAFENLAEQILEKQKLEGITCSSENRYTSQLLLNAISRAVKLAEN
ncbi:MAG: hypothetical protein LUG99_18330 [Lachnospiraceae bacterium]|nr:hypothetical protein [Lachnospiraceae bacterium]